jgi:hypothetical protein
MSRERGTSGDGDQVEYTEAQRDNYALGDLGLTGAPGAGAAVSSEEIEAGTAEGTSPATGEGEDLTGGGSTEVTAGTADESIRAGADSAADLGDTSAPDSDRDALGTTLSYDEQAGSAFDADAANLSAQDDLSVSSEERVTTFQSGTIAHEGIGLGQESGATGQATDLYGDLPDEPAPVDADDTGRDDFSGDEYPSDRRVDDSDSDAGWDAVTADVDEYGSSAGDLETATASGEDLLTADAGDTGTMGVVGDTSIDQDLVGTSDEHVGGEEPLFAEPASLGTDETVDSDTFGTTGDSGTIDVPSDIATGDDLAGAGVADAGPAESVTTFASETSDELGGMGVSDGDVTDELGGMGPGDGDTPGTAGGDTLAGLAVGGTAGGAGQDDGDLPAGAVRGDGTTNTPEGYPIKGNSSSMIYHLPHFPSYANTKAEYCFATEDDAVAAGYRAPGKRNRGKASTSTSDAGQPGGAAGGASGLDVADTTDPAQAGALDTSSMQTDTLESSIATGDAGVPRDTGAVSDIGADDPGSISASLDRSTDELGAIVDDGTESAGAELADTQTFVPAGADTTTGSGSEDQGIGAVEAEASDDPDVPAGAVRGDGTNVCPDGYPVKGNASSMIYHAPGRASYDATVPEFCFATEQDAENAGFRAPKR